MSDVVDELEWAKKQATALGTSPGEWDDWEHRNAGFLHLKKGLAPDNNGQPWRVPATNFFHKLGVRKLVEAETQTEEDDESSPDAPSSSKKRRQDNDDKLEALENSNAKLQEAMEEAHLLAGGLEADLAIVQSERDVDRAALKRLNEQLAEKEARADSTFELLSRVRSKDEELKQARAAHGAESNKNMQTLLDNQTKLRAAQADKQMAEHQSAIDAKWIAHLEKGGAQTATTPTKLKFGKFYGTETEAAKRLGAHGPTRDEPDFVVPPGTPLRPFAQWIE